MPQILSNPNINSDAWEVYEITSHYRRSRLWLSPGQYIHRTEFFADEQLQEENRQLFDASQGKRFGDGKIVGRIPLNKFYSELVPYMTKGDKDHAKWWLNREENRGFRTFRGRV